MKVEELIPLLKERDRFALNEFTTEYSMDILKAISYVLKESYEKTYIEECYDDVIMKIIDKCNTYEYKCPFNMWIMTIAKNKALDYKRKLKFYYNSVEINDDDIKVKSAEESFFEDEGLECSLEIMNSLKYEEKKLFTKRYILNESIEQLCDEYVVNANTLYKRISRIKNKLKNFIENKYIMEEHYE